MQSKQSSDLVKLSIALVDLGLLTLAFYAAYLLRVDALTHIKDYIWLYFFSAPIVLFLMLRYGVLTGYRYRSHTQIVLSTLRALAVAGIVSSAVLFLSKSGYFSRMLFGYYFGLSALFILVEKVVLKAIYTHHVKRGGMNIRIAMVGFGQKFDEVSAEIAAHREWGVCPVLVIDPQQTEIAAIAGQIRRAIVDEVYVCYPRGEVYHMQIDDLLDRIEKLGVPVRVALNFDEFDNYFGQHACRLGTQAGVMLAPYNLDPDQLILKRSMDVVGSLVGMMGTVLILPFVALAIKMESSGSIFFAQNRVGKGGRAFKIYKFRSMYADAEERKHALMEHNIHRGALFKMENDPRITKVGRILRKTSLDEFPQFWNVLKGDMSLVGTRPPTPDEVDEYEDHHFRRISIKPGLTGLWQVSGRNEITDFDEVVALDVKYIKGWDVWLDVKIILRTIGVVVLPGRSGGM